MASEGGLGTWYTPGTLAFWLLIAAAVLSGLAFLLGWFSVDTTIQAYRYDPSQDHNAGDPITPRIRLDMEMRMFSLETTATPRDVANFIEGDPSGYPDYDDEAGKTGTAMLGVFFLHVVSFLALAGAVGLYLMHRRGPRDFGRPIWKFAIVFAALAFVTMAYMGVAVPASAEDDTQDYLQNKAQYFRAIIQNLDANELRPEIAFWKTWENYFTADADTGACNPCVVYARTESRPAAGFWLEGLALLSAGGGIFLARRAGQLEPRPPPSPAGEPGSAAPPPKTV